MPMFDGVVELDGEQVPVILGVEEGGIRLSSNGTEIGEWTDDEYRLEALGADSFVIAADDDALTFRPYRPDAFARTVGIVREAPGPSPARTAPAAAPTSDGVPAAPPPKSLTRALFLTLAGTTAFLGVWALVQLIL